MYGNKSIKHRKDGSKYKDFYYYGCKHRTMTRGHKCDYKKQIQEEVLDASVIEIITKLVSNPRFASLMQEKINMKVDTTAIDQEIKALEKQLKQSYAMKRKTLEEIEQLDPDDRHYNRRKADLDDRLYRMYDKIDDQEQSLLEARTKKQSIESEKVTGDNIYKILIYFDKFYKLMNEEEQRKLMETLIEEIQIYEERQPSGQWLKSITFRLPIIDSDMSMPIGNSLDSESHVETVCLLSKLSGAKHHVSITLDMEEMDLTAAESKATYQEIQEWVQEKYGFHVSHLNIAKTKRKCGIIERKNYNLPKSEDSWSPETPKEKEEAIREAFKYFQMID